MKKELLEKADEANNITSDTMKITMQTKNVDIEEVAQYISMRTNIRFDIALLYLELSEKYLDGSRVYDDFECCNFVCKNTDKISLEDFFLLSRAEIQFYFESRGVDVKKIDCNTVRERVTKILIEEYNKRFGTTTQ